MSTLITWDDDGVERCCLSEGRPEPRDGLEPCASAPPFWLLRVDIPRITRGIIRNLLLLDDESVGIERFCEDDRVAKLDASVGFVNDEMVLSKGASRKQSPCSLDVVAPNDHADVGESSVRNVGLSVFLGLVDVLPDEKTAESGGSSNTQNCLMGLPPFDPTELCKTGLFINPLDVFGVARMFENKGRDRRST